MMADPHSHYAALDPEPIEVYSQWGLAIPAALYSINKISARMWAVRNGAEGYNGRGGIEDADKLIWWATRLKEELQREAKTKG